MEAIYRNKYLNYGYITFMTGIAIVAYINIFGGNFKKFTTGINLSTFNIKLVLSLVVLATYITTVLPSVRVVAENKVKLKTPPRGDRGIRGNRGKSGNDAACSTCGDDLCYKKLLYNITKTINFWRERNGMELLEENYVVPNEYIKDKVKKHCASKKFKKLLTKYGSNNQHTNKLIPCPSDLCSTLGSCDKKCGAYDYMFKMWSIWILIILRFKNGLFFLESEGLNERDFLGLIEKEDAFQAGDVVNNGSDSVTIIDNSEFPFYKLSDGNDVHISKLQINEISAEDASYETKIDAWNNMFLKSKDDSTLNSVKKIHPTDIEIKDFIQKLDMVKKTYDKKKNYKYKFQIVNADAKNPNEINDEFIQIIGRVPGGGLYTPFDEIKKYNAWYWGSDPATKPKITIEQQEASDICSSCSNSYLCTDTFSPAILGIKVIATNSYKLLVNTATFENEIGEEDTYSKPFKNFAGENGEDSTMSDLSIFSVNSYTDPNEDPAFSEYKPLGDVIFLNSEIDRTSNNISKCLPNNSKLQYNGQNFTPIIGSGNKNLDIGSDKFNLDLITDFKGKKNQHIYTILVSGDTLPPVSYTFVESFQKKAGIGSGYETINIWKPVAEDGYMACGYVVDMRPSAGGKDRPKPSRDRIATIPETAYSQFFEAGNYDYSDLPSDKTNIKRSDLYNIFYFDGNNPILESDTSTSRLHICTKDSFTPSADGTEDSVKYFTNTLIKPSAKHEEKYSIQKLFEEDDFE